MTVNVLFILKRKKNYLISNIPYLFYILIFNFYLLIYTKLLLVRKNKSDKWIIIIKKKYKRVTFDEI